MFSVTKMRTLNFLVLAGLILTCSPLFADERVKQWKQEELTEPFMRSLTKAQCMAKTIASLKAGCTSEQCIKTISGVSGDCVTLAKGDIGSFCASFDREYLARYCGTNELDARRCIVLHTGKAVHCKHTPRRRSETQTQIKGARLN